MRIPGTQMPPHLPQQGPQARKLGHQCLHGGALALQRSLQVLRKPPLVDGHSQRAGGQNSGAVHGLEGACFRCAKQQLLSPGKTANAGQNRLVCCCLCSVASALLRGGRCDV